MLFLTAEVAYVHSVDGTLSNTMQATVGVYQRKSYNRIFRNVSRYQLLSRNTTHVTVSAVSSLL